MSKHQSCATCSCDFVGPDMNIGSNICPECDASDGKNTRIEYLESALREVALGRGPYKRDPLDHADSCIDTMKGVAEGAINGTWEASND